jgi:predicted nucleic acid-binding protein
MRIFLDANVLFLAAKSEGLVRRLLDDLIAEGHVLGADSYVAEEARRNLAIKAPDASAVFARLLDRLEIVPFQVDSAETADLSALPEEDRSVLAAAVRGRCDVLVTGDRAHFAQFYGHILAGVAIHSPRSLTEFLL